MGAALVSGDIFESYEYDEADNRIKHTNALTYSDYLYVDSLGRVIKTVNADNITTNVGYTYSKDINSLAGIQYGGYKKVTTDANGRTLIDEVDYFGRTTKHTDLHGRAFTYSYNHAGWLVEQTATSGQRIQYKHFGNGYVKEIADYGLNNLSRFAYDENGNRINEAYADLSSIGGVPQFYQNASITYDSLNRTKHISDAKFNVDYEYDANDNVRHVYASYSDGVNGNLKVQDYWYRYDSMNRFTVTMGQLSTGLRATSEADAAVEIARGKTGVTLTYDARSQRQSAVYGIDALGNVSGMERTENYYYTTDGYLETVNANGMRTTRQSDAIGRVRTYLEYQDGTTVSKTQTSDYFNDNRLKSQTVDGKVNTYDYYSDGTLKTVTNGSSTTTYDYEWWDSAKQKEIKLSAGWAPGWSLFEYDVNGHLKSLRDEGAASDGKRRVLTYVNNSNGQILRRNEIVNNRFNRYRDFFFLNGKLVGDISNDGPSRVDYVQALANSAKPGSPDDRYKNWKPVSSADFDQNYEPIGPDYPGSTPGSYTAHGGDTLRGIALSQWGDADMWYLIADANGLSGTEELKEGQVLVIPNKVTNIHHNSRTFRPYNPGEAIGDTQPTLPSPPPPPPKKKCNGIAIVVMVVVAVVATVLTAGAAAAFLAPAAATAGATTAAVGAAALAGGGMVAGVAATGVALGAGAAIGGAIVGGMVGAAASQLVGKAMGVVDHFSWKQVAIGGATAGLTAGMGAGLNALSTATNWGWAKAASNAMQPGVRGFTNAAIKGGIDYGANYAVNKAAHEDIHFGWRDLAMSSVVNAGVGEAVGMSPFGAIPGRFGGIVSGQVGAATSAMLRDKWFGGSRPNYGQVAANALGQSLASIVVEALTPKPIRPLVRGNVLPVIDELNGEMASMDRHLDQGVLTDASVAAQISPVSQESVMCGPDYVLPNGPSTVKVARGDTVEQLARLYGGDSWREMEAAIVVANDIKFSRKNGSPLIYAGSDLIIPDIDRLNDKQRLIARGLGENITSQNEAGLDAEALWREQQTNAKRHLQQRREAAELATPSTAGGSALLDMVAAYNEQARDRLSLILSAGGPSGHRTSPGLTTSLLNGLASNALNGISSLFHANQAGYGDYRTKSITRSFFGLEWQDSVSTNVTINGLTRDQDPQVVRGVHLENLFNEDPVFTRDIIPGPDLKSQLKDAALTATIVYPFGKLLGDTFGAASVAFNSDYSMDIRSDAAFDLGGNTLEWGLIAAGARRPVPNSDVIRGIGSRGQRNSEVLTTAQQDQLLRHVEELGLNPNDFRISSSFSGYSDNFDTVFLGPNMFQGSQRTARTVFETMTPRAAVAHEAGHLITTRSGTAFEAGTLLDEIGASLTGRQLPGLSNVERYQLLRDAAERARNEGQSLRVIISGMGGN